MNTSVNERDSFSYIAESPLCLSLFSSQSVCRVFAWIKSASTFHILILYTKSMESTYRATATRTMLMGSTLA